MDPERQNSAASADNSAMPNDLTIQAVTAPRSVGSSNDAVRMPAPEPAPSERGPASPIPNPSLQLDPALGLVVIEFRNDSGAVTTSIPTEREIAAYQRWEQTKFGPVPHGLHQAAPEPKVASEQDTVR